MSEFDVKHAVPGLARGLHLLCQFSREESSLAAAELARRLQLPRSTVFRLLSTLESLGFVERTDHGRYRLGTAVLRLGFEYLASLELTELGIPILDKLRNQIRLSCNLVVRDGRFIVAVAKSVAETPFISSVNVGARLPAHATVLGRILLQDLTWEELTELYPERDLETYSSSTPRNTQQLFEMVKHDRDRGYVVAEGFFEARITTIAAPVRGRHGALVAAMGVTVPAMQLTPTDLTSISEKVRIAANQLSALLDYRPATELESNVNQPALLPR
ncbi:IclR family transcriptional regulator [Pandoraea pneumonica]|nr:IclR family transcriptional regulator [Pandoraea pneumonica]